MSLQTIILVNNAVGCDTQIQQQISVTSPSSYLVRLPSESNAIGPFSVFSGSTGSTPIYSAITRNQMITGVIVNL